MSRFHRPAEQAHAEETAKHVPEEPVSSSLVILGKNSVPHVYVTADGRAFVRVVGRGVTLDVSMSLAQLRQIQGQAERVLLAQDLKPVAS